MTEKITYKEFLQFSKFDKCDRLFKKADLLQIKSREKILVAQYTLNGFYAELYFDPEMNKILDVAAYEKF